MSDSSNGPRLAVSEVVFRGDLYPRIETSHTTVQAYAGDLSVLPPIEVNQHNELIDGWHRWTAHRETKSETIPVRVTETSSDAHFLELAITRNAAHGLQLSQSDKREMALRIWSITPTPECEERLRRILSVSRSTLAGWLSRSKKEAKAKDQREALRLWWLCYSTREIGERLGVSVGAASEMCSKNPDLENLNELTPPPLYDVWKQQDASNTKRHPGQSEASWVDRLVYLYSDPGEVVIDPFGGGGSTLDVCRKRGRRCLISDLTPIASREKDIRQHDITTGPLKPPRWSDVALVYLDPPYGAQVQGEYSEKAEDLANMPSPAFHDALESIIRGYFKKLRPGAHVALIIQATQWRAPEKERIDHVWELAKRGLPMPRERIQAPYESQQASAQMVEWAKSERRILTLSREIVVWRVPA